MQHAVHIDTGHTPVQGGKSFHDDAPVKKVMCTITIGAQERHLWSAGCWIAKALQQPAGELKDSSDRYRFGPLYRTCCHQRHSHGAGDATIGGTSQLGAGPVRHRGRAFIRFATFSLLRATSYGALKLGFHARGLSLIHI